MKWMLLVLAMLLAGCDRPKSSTSPPVAKPPSAKEMLDGFNVFAKKFASSLGAVEKRSLESIKIGGTAFTYTCEYHVLSTDIQNSNSLVHPVVFVATFTGSTDVKASNFHSFKLFRLLATFAQEENGKWIILDAVQRPNPKEEGKPAEAETNLLAAPFLAEAVADAQKGSK